MSIRPADRCDPKEALAERSIAGAGAADREVAHMIVELFGSGCEKCQALEDALHLALDDLGMTDEATLY
jgi:hypothetical protein